jgi:hypothetical protein
MKNHAISNITYNILTIEGNYVPNWVMTFERLFLNDIKDGEDFEFVYALGEISEKVMRLKVGESFQFNANRDIAMKNGAIIRMT